MNRVKLLALLYLKRKMRLRKRKVRRVWVRNIFKERKNVGHFYTLIQELRNSDSLLHFNYLRMSKQKFDNLLTKILPLIEKIFWSREPISSAERLAVTLRFLASGDSMASVGYNFRISPSSVSVIIKQVCGAIWAVLHKDVLPHLNNERWQEIANQFLLKWNLPNCIGAIDGKHIVMQAPPNAGSDFYNYKGQHSIVLMAMSDANYCFTYVEVGSQGRQSDGGIFRKSILFKKIKNNTLDIPSERRIQGIDGLVPYFMVGDGAFPLMENLMRPYPGRFLPQKQRIFNYRLSRARRIIENAFGILVSRWRILRKPIIASVQTVEIITLATVCLHNWLMLSNCQTYCSPNYIDHEENGEGNPGQWRIGTSDLRSISGCRCNAYTRNAAHIRNLLANYFVDTGSVPFQWDK